MAGGTNVLFKLRRGNAGYRHVVDIADLPELNGVRLDDDGGLRLGAGCTFRELLASDLVAGRAWCLHEAATVMGGPQLRAQATLGGNLCGGGYCAACRECRFPRCPVGAISADAAAPLLALDAVAEIAGPQGLRQMPLGELWSGPARISLARDELLLAVRIPAASFGASGSTYVKYAMRAAMDTATLGCAAVCRLEGGVFAELRLACIMAGPTPRRLPAAEAAGLGRAPDREVFAAIATAAAGEAKPQDSWQGSAEFRVHIIRQQVERLLETIAQRAEAV
jgi:xanthine dehydrogenase FAD-binding subunit